MRDTRVFAYFLIIIVAQIVDLKNNKNKFIEFTRWTNYPSNVLYYFDKSSTINNYKNYY